MVEENHEVVKAPDLDAGTAKPDTGKPDPGKPGAKGNARTATHKKGG